MVDVTGSGSSGAQPSRRLAVIMFTDLVGYSALAHRNERLAIELLELHRGWIRDILPRHGGIEIETVGDAFLIEFAGAVAAVECAVAVQQCFADHNQAAPPDRRMELRIGIHLGDVEHKDGKVMGDGVNIASRIHGMAEPGGICVSESVYQATHSYGGIDFKSLGRPALKNIDASLELFRLVSGQAASAAQTPSRSRLAGRLPLLMGAAAVAAGVAVLLWLLLAKPAATAGPSVAVLPFENLSAESDSAYFTDGLHDTVIGHLARIQGLKVISRTSVMRYRGHQASLRDIGRELGVAHILEGSVQRAGGRLRVAAQLIDIDSDAHVWSNEYDRDLADVFAVQADIAQQVAAAVHARLTPRDEAAIERVPTTNQEAYDLYLRAMEALRQANLFNRETGFRVQALLEQAIALDPGFALAHAALGRNHMLLYWWGFDTTAQRRDQALASAEAALRLQPDLAEAHVARGTYFYYGFRDYERALKEFGEALNRSPSTADFHSWVGYVQRRQGKWDSALASLSRAVELDPRNAGAVSELGYTHQTMRQYAKAAAAYEKAVLLSPEGVVARLDLAFVPLFWRGDSGPATKALAGIPAGVDPGEIVSTNRIQLALFEGRYAEAISGLNAFSRDGITFGGTNFEVPKAFYLGQAYTAMEEASKARPHFLRARERLQAYMAQQPESTHRAAAHAWLGLTQAYLGERAEASRNADRALELLPVSLDAYDGPEVAQIAIAIHMRVGDQDRALDELAKLMKIPAGPHAHELRRDPEWKPLWNDPRFQKLITDHLPKAG